ncbi:hypothetical protein E2C01_076341 [Portunus trituberculatus]|uniref:Uncharacterized protein n=1 Tax=Portunus trituberculatus TaxID=210409 RepID=A0A5B7IB68_PORTR|nr:hypothetical protein [Portunus trituberculatus]
MMRPTASRLLLHVMPFQIIVHLTRLYQVREVSAGKEDESLTFSPEFLECACQIRLPLPSPLVPPPSCFHPAQQRSGTD